MRSRRIIGAFSRRADVLGLRGDTGLWFGCRGIPLAKVPPPPESFYRVQANAKNHKFASPQNANELRR